MHPCIALLALILWSPIVNAEEKGALVRTHGYVSPHFQAVTRPNARPADQSRIGMTKSKAGIIFSGKVVPVWHFNIHFVVGSDTFDALTRASPVDGNDGTTDSVYTTSGQPPAT